MITKLLRWLFESTPLGKVINGSKTEIGLALTFIWLFLQGLTTGLDQLVVALPSLTWLPSVQVWAASLNSLIGQLAEFLGITLTSVGVVHAVDKLKRATKPGA